MVQHFFWCRRTLTLCIGWQRQQSCCRRFGGTSWVCEDTCAPERDGYRGHAGDLGDLIPALEPTRRVRWNDLAADDLELQLASMGHCSALVKVTGNYSDLLMAHSSWFTYRCAPLQLLPS